jgi:hypothetical protein
MASNPLVDQGFINRLRGTVLVQNYPSLNLTAPFLGKDGVSITLEGNTTNFLETMTGATLSLEPYQMASISVAIVKATGTANYWKTQWELMAAIGPVTITPDTSALAPFQLFNCAIETVGDLPFNGTQAEVRINLKGIYYINSAMWNLV